MNLFEKYKAMVRTPNVPRFSLVIDNTPSTERAVSKLAVPPTAIVEPEAVVCATWVNPHKQGTPEARQVSLLQCLYAILEPTFDRIAATWPRGFISTQSIRDADIEVEKIQALVLSGKAKLTDYRQAVNAWEIMVEQEVKH